MGARPELEDLPEHLPRDDDRGRPAARSAVEEGAEDTVAARWRRAAFLAELGEDEHVPAWLPCERGPGPCRLDVGQQRVDPLVARLAMVIPLAIQSSLAMTYGYLGRHERSMQIERDVYSGRLRLNGEDHSGTLIAANNYASSLRGLGHFKEAKSLLRKMMPVSRRVLGNNNETTLRMRKVYARALYEDASATLDDLREAATTLEETERTARRVMGGDHPVSKAIGNSLRDARAALRARETPSGSA